ncbi:MAG: transglutaminase domain-containing protein [Planctomycetes bacterium]|nr:transglutaminase domain-containing protein [Planctomycetota bacterium]
MQGLRRLCTPSGTLPGLGLALVGLVAAGVFLLALPPARAEHALKSRSFALTYATTIQAPAPDAAKLEFWIPLPQTGPGQTISDLQIESSCATTTEREAEYGNQVLHGLVDAPKGPVTVTLKLNVARTELLADVAAIAAAAEAKEDLGPLARFLQADRLGIIDDSLRSRAGDVTKGRAKTIEKARAIYDHVFDTMSYSKEGKGWGRGDVVYACTEKKGNCSDFHSLFISLARAAGIPARFEMGFPLPGDKTEGTIGGYHCWAQFYVAGAGWVPVDCSEARKHPELKEYYFGCLCQNRVQFSTGRDLRLAPPQRGEPVNFLIYPYVEADGKPYDGFEKTFSFRDLAAAPAAPAPVK